MSLLAVMDPYCLVQTRQIGLVPTYFVEYQISLLDILRIGWDKALRNQGNHSRRHTLRMEIINNVFEEGGMG